MKEVADIVAQVQKRPPETLATLTNYHLTIGIDELVSEKERKDDPPKLFSEKSEIIEIDGCLGFYNPEEREITTFVKGIEKASQIIGCKAVHLEHIVRLHEYSHAIVHIGLSEDDRQRGARENNYLRTFLEQATTIYNSIEHSLHEHLAQLLTHHSLKILREGARHPIAQDAIDQRIKAFKKLNSYQPAEYRLRDEDRRVPRDKIIRALDLLKSRQLWCTFEAWSTIIYWKIGR